MTNHLLTVWINNKEALPVRAISEITNYEMFPQQVAYHFARKDKSESRRLHNLRTYRLVNGVEHAVKIAEWEDIHNSFDIYFQEIDANYDRSAAKTMEYWFHSLNVLPEGVFVWWKSFERSWMADKNRFVQEDGTSLIGDLTMPSELEQSTLATVMEGFGPQDETTGTGYKPRSTPPPNTQNDNRRTHRLYDRKDTLSDLIEQAMGSAPSQISAHMVWNNLVAKAEAEIKEPPLFGFSSEGIQYKGRTYQETGTPDVLTFAILEDRIYRVKKNLRGRD